MLGCSQLTVLWSFQVDSKGTQSHIYLYSFSPNPLPSRLTRNIEQSSMCWAVGPCWLCILNTAGVQATASLFSKSQPSSFRNKTENFPAAVSVHIRPQQIGHALFHFQWCSFFTATSCILGWFQPAIFEMLVYNVLWGFLSRVAENFVEVPLGPKAIDPTE